MKFDRIICSGQKRAIISACKFREGLNGSIDGEGDASMSDDKPHPPIHLNQICHGFRGVSKGTQRFAGLTEKQMLQLCPDLIIGKFIDEDIDDEVETLEEMIDRIKELIRQLKELHVQYEQDGNTDATVLLISHGSFLKFFMALLTG